MRLGEYSAEAGDMIQTIGRLQSKSRLPASA
jgi:hypothetical protein